MQKNDKGALPFIAASLGENESKLSSSSLTSRKRGKSALIAVGGGMRSVHGAGFLYALGKDLGLFPDILIASSGNSGNALYFAARQYEYLKRAWTDYVYGSRFISWKRFWKVMDIDWLIDTIFKLELPLQIDDLLASPVKAFISVTEALSGKNRYLTPQEVDPYELLRASKAIPFFFGRTVELKGKKYFDGEIGPTLHDHIAKARGEGATRIVVLDDSSAPTRV